MASAVAAAANPDAAAIAGRRLAHFRAGSRTPARRAWIGSPASPAPGPPPTPAAEPYRRWDLLEALQADRLQVAVHPPIDSGGGSGSCSATCRNVANTSSAWNGGRAGERGVEEAPDRKLSRRRDRVLPARDLLRCHVGRGADDIPDRVSVLSLRLAWPG